MTRAALLAFLVLLYCAAPARAQFTLVSGTVTDPNGLPWACGTISAQLVNNNGVSATLNGVSFSASTAPVKLGCPTDPTTSRTAGFFQMQLADNTVIKCGIATCGTQTTWQFTVNTTGIAPPQGTGPQSFTNTFTISGASQTLPFSGVPALSLAGSSGGGIPTVTRGLLADCPLTETSGTSVNCGAAGSGTFGAGTAAPAFPSIAGVGTSQAMDNFTNATLATAGNWSAIVGTFTVTAGNVAMATNGGAGGESNAIYTGIPQIGQNQFAQTTVTGTPGSGGVFGPAVRSSSTVGTFYGCGETGTTLILYLRVGAAASSNLATQARTGAAGDVITLSVQENSGFSAATLTCTVTGAGGTVTITATDSTIWTGTPGIAGAGTSSVNTVANFRAGSLDTSVSGGLLFGGGQFVTLPASLNSALSVEVYGCFQITSNNNSVNAFVVGNGNGAASNANGLVLNGTASADTMAGLLHLGVSQGSTLSDTQLGLPNGCAMSAAVYGNNTGINPFDRLYINGLESTSYGQNNRSAAAGLQTVGAYQLGGAAAGSGLSVASFYTGTIYRIRFFSVQLTPSEISQDSAALAEYMSGRGVTGYLFSNSINDTCAGVGDSQTSGSGLAAPTTQAWTQLTTFFSPANSSGFANSGHCWNMGMGGTSSGAALANFANGSSVIAAPDQVTDPLYTPNGNRNVAIIWAGTNDLLNNGASFSSQVLDIQANYTKARHVVGWKTIVSDIISRGSAGSCSLDINFQTYNPLVRQAWPVFSDGFVDLASFTQFATGKCTNTTYFNADNIHPNAYGHSLIAFFFQREVNTIFGNRDWNSANTYTATAAAATATTAGSETGSIGTITMAATQPFPAGACVVIAGVTPAGYNTPAGDCYLVLTANSTQITLTLPVTGLGVITVQGTVTTSQELDQDQYAILGGAAAGPIHTLGTCQGRPGHVIYRMITNTNPSPWIITPFQASETINGGATFTTPVASATNHPIVALKCILTSNTAGGGTWQASLQ